MEKETIKEINEKLQDVPPGMLIHISHQTDGTSETVKQTLSSTDKTVRIRKESYRLYPGMEITYHFCLADSFSFRHKHKASILSLDYCRRGRIGWEMKDGLSMYFGNGELSFHCTDKCSESRITLPLGYYEGISLALDPAGFRTCLPEIIREANIDPAAFCKKFCRENETAAFPADSRIGNIFSDMYNLPETKKFPYLKLKCQELLLFLDTVQYASTSTVNMHCSTQTEIIREIHDLITSHPERRYTIDELSKQYLINTATLKNVFKAVYGMPVASYMKQYRIMQAARMLKTDNNSIAVVAKAVGYESQSKFTAAFKDIMKILPTDYRRQYQ